MARMISNVDHEYPFGVKLKSGDEFDCETKDVELLTVLGRARVKSVSDKKIKSGRRASATEH